MCRLRDISTSDPEMLCSAVPLNASQATDRRSRTCVPLHNSHAHAATASTPALCKARPKPRREPSTTLSSTSPRLCTHLHNIPLASCLLVSSPKRPLAQYHPVRPVHGARKLGCNNGLQRSLCPSLSVTLSLRHSSRQIWCCLLFLDPTGLTSPTLAHTDATGLLWNY
jgi:hypothetical protein